MADDRKRREIGERVLSKNDTIAAENRARFAERGLYVVNLIGSPGSGKTSLLEATIRRLDLPVAVIQGDVQTTIDADRVTAAGADAYQIETGGACHLDARMVARAMDHIDLDAAGIVFIENVGNLVCPTGYDLGETEKAAVLSVPEGDEKPVKYPSLFVRAGLVVITKTDLIPYTDFSMDRATADLAKLHAGVTVLPLSSRTGDGLDAWCAYLSGKAGPRSS